MNNYLLASFIPQDELLTSVNLLKEHFHIIGNRIFVLKNIDNEASLVLTYNIEIDQQLAFDQVLSNTIRVHRKKETNTLYSLNALNHIVKLQNNNKLDKSFIIDWTEYRNTIITLREGELKCIGTKLQQVLNI